MTRVRGLPLGLLLFVVLAAFGLQLHDAQQKTRDAAERRFQQRANISAALTESVFSALGSASAADLRKRLGGPLARRRRNLDKLVRDGRLGYASVVDAAGRRLLHSGVPGPPRGAGDETPEVLSDVQPSAAGPVVEFASPFSTPAGRRVLVSGVPVATLRPFVEDLLRRLPNPDGSTLTIGDSNGAVLARVRPPGLDDRPGPKLTVKSRLPGTTWHLRLRADRARVLAGAGGGAWLSWALLAGLALAILTGLWLFARVAASSRHMSVANRALREGEGKLRALVGALEEGVFLMYADGRTELLNQSAKELAETEAEVIPEQPTDWLLFSDDGVPLDPAETPAGISLARGTAERRVIGMDRPDRERIWLDISTRPLFRHGESAPYAVVCSCTDVTERQHLEAHLLDLADRDPLTGLWNRRRFEQDVAHQLDRCRRYGEQAAIVVMDVDGFKQVNDVLGHLAGDETLCAMGDALSARLRSTDRAARLGGDEFAVLLLDVGDDDVDQVASELGDELCKAAASVQERIALPVSVGTARLDRSTGGVLDALEAADKAMYAAKQSRGGRLAPVAPARPEVGATAEMASLRALLAAVNARDSYTAMHSREVVTLARGVARHLGLDAAQTSVVEHIALLHDLGKIAIPDAILRKPGPLTRHERTLMRQHPVVGAQILASMPELAHLAPAVRAEHERWDGQGYPDGLTGEEIPIASRIALVCDAYHAMTSTRPYRRAMSNAAARAEIGREAGAQFCPHASAALLELLAASAVPA